MSRRRIAVVLVLLGVIAGSLHSPVLTLAQRLSPAGSGALTPDTLCLDGSNQDTGIARSAANVVKFTNCSSTTYATLGASGGNGGLLSLVGSATQVSSSANTLDVRTTDASDLWFGVNGARKWRMVGSSGDIVANTDNANDIGASNATRPKALFLAAPAITASSGTGITLNDSGSARDLVYKITLLSTAFSAAAVTADATIATLPAKTLLKGVWVDVTTKFIGGAVSAATMTCGTAAGGAQYVASFDIFTNAITRGLADADMGTLLVRSAAIQGGTMPSFSATQIVTCRVTTTTANTNALTQGSVTYYLWTVVLP